MIFDNSTTTELVLKWQKTADADCLADIVKECDALIEVIVSRFDNTLREELVQDCRMIIIDRISKFDPKRGKLHSWLTSVITNHCINYVTTVSRLLNIEDLGITVEEEEYEDYSDANFDASDIIIRNRKRFSSIPSSIIDNVTYYICVATIYTVHNKSRGIIRHITGTYGLDRTVATVIYHSTLLYLRKLHIEECDNGKTAVPDELSLLKDMKDILGDDVYETVSILFAGMYIKFP